MAIPIDRGHNFFCQTFSDPWLGDIPDEIQLDPAAWASKGLPVIPGEHWERWLGEISFRAFGNSLVLTVTGAQPAPDHVVNEDLKRRLNHLTFGLVLQGVPSYRESFLIGGANESGNPEPRQFGRARVFCTSRDLRPLIIGKPELERAVDLARKLAVIDRAGEDWRRLRRGVEALMKGSAEWRYEDERLHEFVRCLEALILPAQGQTRRQFIHRAQTFAIASDATKESLEQAFDVRSQVEHLHSALDVLPGTREQKETLLYRRVRQIDVLARSAVRRVLDDQALMETFKTDEGINDFWCAPDDQRLRRWGDSLELQSIT